MPNLTTHTDRMWSDQRMPGLLTWKLMKTNIIPPALDPESGKFESHTILTKTNKHF
jgi:hypothetical protein